MSEQWRMGRSPDIGYYVRRNTETDSISEADGVVVVLESHAKSLVAYLNALEERVRAAEADLAEASDLHHTDEDVHALYAQLAASESARQAAEQRVSELTGPFPDARSNWTKDQWKQLALLARHRVEAAEGRAATLQSALEALTWTGHQAWHNWKLHGVIDCPEQECVESRAACGYDALSSPVPAARDGEAEA